MELSACIVVYNGCDEALKAAQTVLQYTRRHPLTLYLVDNASPDGSGARLEAAVKGGALSTQPGQKVEVRCRKENGGFGTGHNTVLPELTSDYHFILNPDIQLTADTLRDLADWMAAHPDAVMARPGLLELTHILRGMLARSDFRCCCSRAEVSGRGQDFRNPTPTRTPVVNHSMRQTCRVTDFAAFGARVQT